MKNSDANPLVRRKITQVAKDDLRIGFIGIGIMGRPMVLNLLKRGFSVSVYNRTPEKCKSVATHGAAVSQSPRSLAAVSNMIITMLSDTPDVEAVLFGKDGVGDGLVEGSTIIDMSTISPDATIAYAARIREKGCEMVDAPVSGGQKGATEGTLSIMVGGKPEEFEKCLPIFHAMGTTITYTGPNGNGQKTKLVNQVIGAMTMLAVSEGFVLARASGLDAKTTLQVVSKGAASSWPLLNLGDRLIKGDFAPGFSINLLRKDLTLAEGLSSRSGTFLPGTHLALSLYSKAIEMGLGEMGHHGLINIWAEDDLPEAGSTGMNKGQQREMRSE